MQYIILTFLLIVTFTSAANIDLQRTGKIDEDAILSAPELIRKYGYPVEEYQVVTPDGYILTLHRIPHGKGQRQNSGKVAFLQHGVLCSSIDWVITGPTKGLGYILADNGYDVWMGNTRGNTYSRNHTVYNPNKDLDFWMFSWHEIGYYDLPTMIDFVLEKTGQQKLYHIGHSQGTTTFYVMTSMRPQYNDKILAHISLAPIAFMNHLKSPLIRLIAFWQKPVELLIDLIGVGEFLPSNKLFTLVGDALCGDDDISQFLCSNFLFVLCGFSPKEMNATLLPAIVGHTPAGASSRQMLHYGQEVSSGHFRQYDYGIVGNLKKYGSMFPPDYNLKNVKAPVYLLYSNNDWMAHVQDVTKLSQKLGNCQGRFLVSDTSFNHLDYQYGIDAPKYVYNKVLSLLTHH